MLVKNRYLGAASAVSICRVLASLACNAVESAGCAQFGTSGGSATSTGMYHFLSLPPFFFPILFLPFFCNKKQRKEEKAKQFEYRAGKKKWERSANEITASFIIGTNAAAM